MLFWEGIRGNSRSRKSEKEDYNKTTALLYTTDKNNKLYSSICKSNKNIAINNILRYIFYFRGIINVSCALGSC